jgi:multicomponent Na+:H+ antiporter subunit D
MLMPIAALAMLTIGIGIVPEWLYELADRSAAELLERNAYITAVLGTQP